MHAVNGLKENIIYRYF